MVNNTQILSLEGPKGGGKDNTLSAILPHLPDAVICAPFTVANAILVQEHGEKANTHNVALRSRADAVEVMRLLWREYQNGLSKALAAGQPLLLNRGVITVWCTLEDARCAGAISQAEMDRMWAPWQDIFPPTAFIYAEPEDCMARRKNDADFQSVIGDAERQLYDYQRQRALTAANSSKIVGYYNTSKKASDYAGTADVVAAKVLQDASWQI